MFRIEHPRKADAEVWINPFHIVAIWRHTDHYTRIRMIDGSVHESAANTAALANEIRLIQEGPCP